jgi:hypothetical protein
MPRQRHASRKQKSKSRKKVTPEEGWWSIKAIVDERIVNGCVEYLVDWEPDHVTGATYEPTWSTEVTDEAKAEWGAQKAPAAVLANPNSNPAAETVASPGHESEDSQPPQPSSRRHRKRNHFCSWSQRSSSSPASEDEQRPVKRIRTELSAPLSDDPVPSLASAASAASPTDFGDIDVVEQTYTGHKVTVEIQKDPGFDPSEYQTQSTPTSSSQAITDLESRDALIAISSQLSQRTVPDSQEVSGESWSQCRTHSQASASAAVVVLSSGDDSSALACSDTAHENLKSPLEANSQVQAEESTQTNSDIPSRQVVSSEAQSSEQRNSLPRSSSNKDSQPQVSRSASPVSPVYLTQPPSRSGSPSRSNLVSPNLVVVEITTSEEDSTHLHQNQSSQRDCRNSQPPHRDSQAAQITRPISDSIPESFTSGSAKKPPGHSLASSRPREKEISTLFLEEFEGSFRESSFSAYAENLSSQARIRRGDSVVEMETPGGDRPSSADRRASAMDALKQLCNFDDIIGDLTPVEAEDDGQAQVPLEPQQDLPDAGLTMSTTSDIGIHTQPLDQRTHWMPDSISTSQGLETDSLTSAPLLTQPPMDIMVERTIQPSDVLTRDSSTGTLLPGSHDLQQGTVSPADITRVMADPSVPLDSLPELPQTVISPSALDISGQSITMAQLPIRNDEELGSVPSSFSDNLPTDHLITLPFHARVRPIYDDTILEYRHDIKRFGDIFSSATYTEPESSLLDRIDQLLARLQTLCDYPQDFDGNQLASLSPKLQAKYAYDANPKFNFVWELLALLEKDANVLIVAQSQEVIRLLRHVAEILEIDCRCDSIGHNSNIPGSTVRLTVALPSEQNDAGAYDIVIGFDAAYTHSKASQQLSSLPGRKSPHVLMLVTTHSIEHIDIRIVADLTALERRSALISCIVGARKLVSDPDRGCPEPAEVAKLFGDYFNGGVESVDWDPVPIPDAIMDVCESLQPDASAETPGDNDNGQKRKLDEEDGSDAKRMRTMPPREPLPDTFEPVLTSEVRQLLDGVSDSSATNSGESKVLVSVSVLEALAEQFAGYRHKLEDTDYTAESKRVIDGLEKQVKEYERTTNQIYGKFRAAIQDRTKYEKEKNDAETAARVQSEKLLKKISELEAANARLSKPTEVGEPQAAAPSDDSIKEARAKIEALEKKLKSAQEQLGFVTSQYQDVRGEATSMKSELTELRSQNELLMKTSSDNFSRIHQIQAEASAKQLQVQIEGYKEALNEKAFELGRMQEELRLLRNGRRETRQVSAPRSPRGMMSPRTGRAYGGSTSRGTSPAPGSGTDGTSTTPVPGMQYLTQQGGNGRWNHLRE